MINLANAQQKHIIAELEAKHLKLDELVSKEGSFSLTLNEVNRVLDAHGYSATPRVARWLKATAKGLREKQTQEMVSWIKENCTSRPQPRELIAIAKKFNVSIEKRRQETLIMREVETIFPRTKINTTRWRVTLSEPEVVALQNLQEMTGINKDLTVRMLLRGMIALMSKGQLNPWQIATEAKEISDRDLVRNSEILKKFTTADM